MNQDKHLYSEIIEVLRKPVMSVLPGHLSFFLLLSAIPLILIFVSVASAFSLSYDALIEFITLSLPASTSKLILPLFTERALDFSVTLLAITAIYLASRGAKAIILAANNIYGGAKNPIQEIIKSLIITILLIAVFIFLILILILGEMVLKKLTLVTQLSFISNNLLGFIKLVRWPLALFVIFFLIKIIYTLTPNKKIKSKTVNKGSLFTTIGWLIITYIYSFYVTNYASYNTYFGSASNIVILMIWVFMVSQIFVIGMVINSIEDKKLNEKTEVK